jgi:CBS domain-containing protein
MSTKTVPYVRDAMSAVPFVVRDHDTIWAAVERFVQTGVHHLIVLDEQDHLVGVLDDRRVLAEWPTDVLGPHHRTLGETLRRHAGDARERRTTPAVSLRTAAQQMLDLRVDALVVVDDVGAVLGILTGTDIIRSLLAGDEGPDDSQAADVPD